MPLYKFDMRVTLIDLLQSNYVSWKTLDFGEAAPRCAVGFSSRSLHPVVPIIELARRTKGAEKTKLTLREPSSRPHPPSLP